VAVNPVTGPHGGGVLLVGRRPGRPRGARSVEQPAWPYSCASLP
jgi:hypothetical protein